MGVNTSVVDQNVDPAEGADGGVEGLAGSRLQGDVTGDDDRAAAAAGCALRGLGQLFGAAPDQNQISSLPGEGPGRGGTQTGACPGDNRDLPVQLRHCVPQSGANRGRLRLMMT